MDKAIQKQEMARSKDKVRERKWKNRRSWIIFIAEITHSVKMMRDNLQTESYNKKLDLLTT